MYMVREPLEGVVDAHLYNILRPSFVGRFHLDANCSSAAAATTQASTDRGLSAATLPPTAFVPRPLDISIHRV